eukprot:c6817_g1_i1.p1 GENE.c6817_g1_i1~~c6817_g1_i1.p1  ORF type:complete len:159 (+),score=39.18 c6817_g1_i1:320-796(+)
MALAEQEREGGVGIHVSPMLTPPDVGNLLSQAGFNIPTVDIDRITYHYSDMFVLMRHLQGMGENNASIHRRQYCKLPTLVAANAVYDHMFGTNVAEDDQSDNHVRVVPATFEIIHMIGWGPHDSQQKPLSRGSATFSLKDIDNSNMFEVTETSLNKKQ